MAVPTFNGIAMFGLAVSMRTRSVAAVRQENAFPGQNGVESIVMGSRGRYIDATGWLFAANYAALEAVDAVLRGYQESGRAYALGTTTGTVWPYAIMESFDPNDRIMTDPYRGVYHSYLARFRLLI